VRWDCLETEAIAPPYLAPSGVMTGAKIAAMIAVTVGRTGAMTGVTGGRTAAFAVAALGCCAASCVRARISKPAAASPLSRAMRVGGSVTW
jgi:hypothetical protein